MAGAHIRVLLVEDDGATRQTIAEFLEERGFAVISAVDGAHALRLARAGDPDVILLDVGLPVLDAVGFAAGWSERDPTKAIPIVVMSGQVHGRAVADKIGAAAFYPKPLDLPSLAETLRMLATRAARGLL